MAHVVPQGTDSYPFKWTRQYFNECRIPAGTESQRGPGRTQGRLTAPAN
jgi:hypothetical protein